MVPSIAGLLVCAGIWLMALRSDSSLLVALLVSFAFGSTAIVTLPALGGSSPLTYVVFAIALIVSVLLRRHSFRELNVVLSQQPEAWLLIILALYTIAGAFLLPRIFAGQTTAFVPQRDGGGGIAEVLLAPVAGNITQSFYFLLGILLFFALSVLLLQQRTLLALRQGYFGWAIAHVVMGFIDFLGKLAGAGDLLSPIRSAAYAMLAGDRVGAIWRISGGYSEASAFGAMSISLLAFTFTYWRGTHSRLALALSMSLMILLVLSTSTTGYVAGAILLIFLLLSIAGAALRDRLRTHDLVLLVATFLGIGLVLGILLYDQSILDPISDLFETMVVNKASSASGLERAYWNWRSLQSFVDTAGLGIGIGSSRASSWIIAVISQLGVVGALIIGFLTFQIICGVGSRESESDCENRTVARSVRAACFAWLLAASISSSEANPGLLFFVALAVILHTRSPHRTLGLVSRRYLLPTAGRCPVVQTP